MPTLKESNGLVFPLAGLGKNTDFRLLSEKRVTKCTRDFLRQKYGPRAIQVSCSARFNDSRWNGVCWIEGEKFNYSISTP